MKSNKGFTLIELLAVIVILAIIALIATPIILGVIDTAKKGSAEASALAYVKALEDQIVIGQVTTETTDDITVPATEATAYDVDTYSEVVKVKGTTPSSGSVTLGTDGEVDSACLVLEISGSTYNVHYDGTKAEVKDAACTPANEG